MQLETTRFTTRWEGRRGHVVTLEVDAPTKKRAAKLCQIELCRRHSGKQFRFISIETVEPSNVQ